ncbi:hypothetical protein [Streptosporangium sp. NPDC003464]
MVRLVIAVFRSTASAVMLASTIAGYAFMQHPHVIESDDEAAIGTAISAAMDVFREAVEEFA